MQQDRCSVTRHIDQLSKLIHNAVAAPFRPWIESAMNDTTPNLPVRPHWEPVRHTVFQDATLAQRIHDDGFAVVRLWSDRQLTALQSVCNREHRLQPADGGMFYSVYSQDLAYRRRVHDEIAAIMRPTLDEHFVDYRNVVNMFVVKAPGPASEFGLHQDTTALDEFRYSLLSICRRFVTYRPTTGHSAWCHAATGSSRRIVASLSRSRSPRSRTRFVSIWFRCRCSAARP